MCLNRKCSFSHDKTKSICDTENIPRFWIFSQQHIILQLSVKLFIANCCLCQSGDQKMSLKPPFFSHTVRKINAKNISVLIYSPSQETGGGRPKSTNRPILSESMTYLLVFLGLSIMFLDSHSLHLTLMTGCGWADDLQSDSHAGCANLKASRNPQRQQCDHLHNRVLTPLTSS